VRQHGEKIFSEEVHRRCGKKLETQKKHKLDGKGKGLRREKTHRTAEGDGRMTEEASRQRDRLSSP